MPRFSFERGDSDAEKPQTIKPDEIKKKPRQNMTLEEIESLVRAELYNQDNQK